MAIGAIKAGLGLIDKIIDKVVPDKDLATKIKAATRSEEYQGDLSLLVGQMEVNKVEAAHKSLFVAGWRPFVGWTCGIGLFYNFILYPFLGFIVVVFMEEPPELPVLDAAQLMTLVTGMLGLVTNRSWEKGKGVSREK